MYRDMCHVCDDLVTTPLPASPHGRRFSPVPKCRYETAVRQGEINEEDIRRENAKQALERYMHYYERWSENDKAKETAAKKTVKIQEHDLEKYSQTYAQPTSDLKYIIDACLQVTSSVCQNKQFTKIFD